MKKIFVIDWSLMGIFVLTAVSGFGMHISGTRCSHDIWHNWAVVHTCASIAFLVTGIMHIQTHWGWYKIWFKKGLGNKSRVTALLSIIFIMTSVSGIISFVAVEGCNSPLGLWHYRLGIFITIIGLAHFIKRLPILRKSLKAKKTL